MLFQDPPCIEGGVTLGGEGVCVQSYERVFGVDFLEGVVQR